MKWCFFASACLIAVSVHAEGDTFLDSFSLGVGESRNQCDIYRLGLRKDSSSRWLSNDTGWLSMYYEASLNDWNKGAESVYGAACSPVFVYYFGAKESVVNPYVEAGIGVACISETELGGRHFSTAFQFEDRIGAGVRMKRADFSIRYMHYSNGSLVEPNDGIDIFIITASYRL